MQTAFNFAQIVTDLKSSPTVDAMTLRLAKEYQDMARSHTAAALKFMSIDYHCSAAHHQSEAAWYSWLARDLMGLEA